MDLDQLVVFDHGINAGHEVYFEEIRMLVRRGYTVYSYDHTGCMASGGDGIGGFAQGIHDLDCVLDALCCEKVKVVGHSWGGYNAMNVCLLHEEVSHVVSIAGFVSTRLLIEQYMPWFVRRYVDQVMELERQLNPMYADMDARSSLLGCKAKVMHIQSQKDPMVSFDCSYKLLSDALKDREGVVLLETKGKTHDPQRVQDGVMQDEKVWENIFAFLEDEV